MLLFFDKKNWNFFLVEIQLFLLIFWEKSHHILDIKKYWLKKNNLFAL